MATHQDSHHVTSDWSPSRPSSVSVTSEVHRSTGIPSQQPNNFQNDESISDYTIIPTEEEFREEIHRPSSTSPSGIDEGDLNQTEKNSLLYQPLDRVSTLKQWSLEFAALLTSVTAFIVMVILLVVSDGKPQPAWAYSVSINTLVAILTTLLRAAMLFVLSEVFGQAKWLWMSAPRPLRHVEHFDNAGKGAWGSLKFLVAIRKPNATVLGALIVVASYATGPLSQQAVKTYSCEVSSVGIARILTAERVTRHDSEISGAHTNAKMSTAIINGLLGIPPDSSLLFKCESGNCVFENLSGVTHSSVGVCSKCADVKSDLNEFEDSKTKLLGRYRNNYRFHKDSNFSINTGVEPELFNTTTIINHHDESPIITSFLTLSVEGCVAQRNPDAPADRYCEHDYKNMPRLSSDLDIVAANCSLYPCIRYYSGNVTNGTLNEHLLSTEPLSHNGSLYVSMIQPCIIDERWYDLSNITDAPRDGLAWAGWTSDGVTKEAPGQCVRTMNKREFHGIRLFFEDKLKGECKLFDVTENGPTSPEAVNGIGNSSQLQCQTGWWLDALYSGGLATFDSLASAHDNMSVAITNRMRLNGRSWSETETSNSYQEGTCNQTSICVRLEAWWLLYPAALLVLTSALLVAAYVQSCRDSGKQPIWKSSILPLIFYNISEEHSSNERNDGREIGSSVPLLQLSELESRADKTIVSFCGGKEGARFIVEEGVVEAKGDSGSKDVSHGD
ncbi:hypothetical protein BDP81DRAFT_447859 [Colletotrichum phormii]|uniref:Uncharacterized protein n=1 Tax=Colletotrichum phormii TaxID=359342 RepID=A0AAJ0EJE8_9PEZI|nr:uncharacterized protein BDP81DRAFT_447859 [Colletotrichum phormii]KAK1638966.1 hypothetical protein BDP81DRAFT_447859 [Colletotrichum phormii]